MGSSGVVSLLTASSAACLGPFVAVDLLFPQQEVTPSPEVCPDPATTASLRAIEYLGPEYVSVAEGGGEKIGACGAGLAVTLVSSLSTSCCSPATRISTT
jgi:hypothetical protein